MRLPGSAPDWNGNLLYARGLAALTVTALVATTVLTPWAWGLVVAVLFLTGAISGAMTDDLRAQTAHARAAWAQSSTAEEVPDIDAPTRGPVEAYLSWTMMLGLVCVVGRLLLLIHG